MRKAVVGVFLMFCATTAQAQDCELVRSGALNTIGGGAVTYFSGPVTFACPNNVRISADSAIFVKATDRFDFLGNVRYADAERDLTAMNAQYARAERKIMAQINVVLTNRKDGSTLRGTSLDYYQQSPGNPQPRIEVYTGRPRAVMMRRRGNATAVDTTVIDSDRMQIIGEETFRGWGNVQTRRGKLRSNSQYAEFNEASDRMRLTGQASVQSDTFNLRADTIDALLVDGDEFKEVDARNGVVLDSEDVDLSAPALRLFFAKGEVERMVARGGALIGGSSPQARAISPDFMLVADSIDAVSPQQKLQRVFAIGRAIGERRPDTLDNALPELINRDWVRGDTVRAYFTSSTNASARAVAGAGAGNSRVAGQRVGGTAGRGDTTQVLERILATGNPASSTYRLREQVGDSTQLSVNYITAKKLDVTFKEGAVDRVQAEGNIRGLYLQPPQRAETSPADRTRRPQ